MKTVFKFIAIALTAIAPLAAAPATTFAVTTVSATNVCSKVPTLETKFESAASTHIATMNSDFSKRLSDISDRSTTLDPKVKALRVAAATKFDQYITTLEATPDLTDQQKTAITAFQTQMKTAEQTREEAVDAARQTYRTQLTATVKDHQTALTTATTTFKDAVVLAFSTAATNCADTTAIATLKSSIKDARATFTTARQSAKVSTQIKTLAATRNAAIKAADDAFAKTAATYATGLKSVLGASTSPSPSA